MGISQQIYEVEQRKRDAQTAERQRLAVEQANQSAIAQADREIASLREAEARQHETQLREAVRQQAAANDQAVKAMFDTLKALTAQLAGMQLDDIGESVQESRDKAQWAASDLYQSIATEEWNRGQTQLSQFEATYGASGKFRLDQQIQNATGARLGHQNVGLTPVDALVLFVSEATTPADKRTRQAVAFMITGQLIDTPPGYMPDTGFKVFVR